MRRSWVLFFLVLSSCAVKPQLPLRPPVPLSIPKRFYQDLREPIYLMINKSFFFGCEKETSGEELCRKERVLEVQNGVNDWFKHFYAPFAPRVFIVESFADVPEDAINLPIHLRVKQGFCDSRAGLSKRWACYFYSYRAGPTIVFDLPMRITPRIVAHEFGHALGCGHNDEPEGGKSVMKSFPDSDVTPVDLKILCQIHKECPAYEKNW